MSAVDFDVLKLIPKMLEEMQDLKKEVTELKQLKKAFDSALAHYPTFLVY